MRLPVELIWSILKLLPLKEAVRSSLLSKQFRHIAHFVPSVDLDLGFRSDADVGVLVDAILASHSVPILNFSLRASSPLDKAMFQNCQARIKNYEARVDNWVRILSQQGIRGLSLASQWPITRGYALLCSTTFPPALFSCTQLTSLKLQNFNFNGQSSLHLEGFPNLVTLELDTCHIGPGYSRLVARCPRLEDLTLRECFISSILSAPTLERLHVCTCRYNPTSTSRNDFLVPLARDCTKLRRVTLCETYPCIRIYDLERLVARFSRVETLCFGSTRIFEDKPTLEKLPGSKTLDCLRELTLGKVNFENPNQLTFLICIINSSPNLEKLTLTHGYYSQNYSHKWEEGLDHKHVIESTLRRRSVTRRKLGTVELRKVSTCKWALRHLLGFLMDIAPSLETIAIETETPELVDPITLELEQTKSQAKIAYLPPLQPDEHHHLLYEY